MQKAQLLPAQLAAFAAALIVVPFLVGCGGGREALPQQYGADLDFSDRQKKQIPEASGKFLDPYGSEELLRPSVQTPYNRTVSASGLDAILEPQTSAAAASQ
jgi:hypothetical protein